MGWQNAAHVLMTSDWFGAEELKEMGYVFLMTAPGACLSDALDYASKLSAQPLASLVATKRLMVEGRLEERMAAHRREGKAFTSGLLGGPANREALKAFAEKRAPDFSKL